MRLVIFDMDGTLVDTVEGYMMAVNEVLEKEGYPIHALDRFREWIGGGITNFVRQAVPSGTEPKEQERLVGLVEKAYLKEWSRGVRVYPGIPALLEKLRQRGILVAINTNKVEEVAQRIAEAFFPETAFLGVIGEKPGFPNKPHPGGILELLQKSGISSAEAMFVGDSEYDVETARGGNVFAVAVTWGYREEKFLVSADRIIHAPEELLAHIPPLEAPEVR